MLKLIRENYFDRAEAFASATGLPPEIIRNFLSENGKKTPYEIAHRISSHFGESPECMCREADVDDFTRGFRLGGEFTLDTFVNK